MSSNLLYVLCIRHLQFAQLFLFRCRRVSLILTIRSMNENLDFDYLYRPIDCVATHDTSSWNNYFTKEKPYK